MQHIYVCIAAQHRVYEEDWDDGKLTEAINTSHTNPKYLPGVVIGSNLVAVPDLEVQTNLSGDLELVSHQLSLGGCKTSPPAVTVPRALHFVMCATDCAQDIAP